MNILRKLEVGDAITSKGVTAVISKIISQDALIPEKGSLVAPYINIEFVDTKGKYRSWKSESDGGSIDYTGSEYRFKCDYYDPYCGWYNIPLDDVDGETTKNILSLLEKGFALCSHVMDESMYYTIFDLNSHCKKYGQLDVCMGVLEKLLRRYSLNLFTKISLDDYITNSIVQIVIDEVLADSYTYSNNGWRLALVFDKGYFKFVEVLDAFI